MDITQLILDDHHEQRRLFAIIDEIGPDDRRALQVIWRHLRTFLETHAKSEERFFYPELLKLGRGADGESADAETRDAIKDHNEIRDKAAEVDKEETGSDQWFGAIAAVRKANSDHMAEEERQGLADFRRHASLQLRHRLGADFIRFELDHLTGSGVKAVDRNVDEYVLENS